MKIEGPKRTQQASKGNKADKSSGAEGSFGAYLAAGTKSASGPSVTTSVAAIDALLAVQGAEDPTERAAKKRMQQRGETLLQELDKIKMAMVTGALTVGHVLDIADVVASHREKFNDPKLASILDEIDLRAQIEIAKMKKALDSKK